MKEGWNDDSYFVVFDDDEARLMTESYGIAEYLPGYRIVALRGWDDFVVEDETGQRFTVPTVPLDAKYMAGFDGSDQWDNLESDDRVAGKIKWYIKPTIFGGDPSLGPNLTWVDPATHQQLVRFWNDAYREVLKATGA